MGLLRPRAVIFDLDGTLVDSAPDIHAAASRMLREMGRPELDLASVASFIGNGVARLVERCLAATGGSDEPMREAARIRFEKHYEEEPAALSTLYPGVRAALGAVRADGARLGVCTNKPQGLALRVLEQLDLLADLDAVAGAEAGRALKPDPASLNVCLERLGAAPDAALYVGDSEVDSATAAAAGLRFALFTGGYRRRPAEAIPAHARFDLFDALPVLVSAGAA
jgi:phosphoglycolate phosphatase